MMAARPARRTLRSDRLRSALLDSRRECARLADMCGGLPRGHERVMCDRSLNAERRRRRSLRRLIRAEECFS